MFSGGIVVLFVVFALIVVAIAVAGHLAEKRRREALTTLAAARGWTYVDEDPRWVDGFAGAPFGLGHRRSATHVIMGSYDDRPFVAFDYTYHTTETSHDAQGHTTTREVSHTFGVVALDVGTAFPPLEVTPEGFFSRMIGRLTNRDIELESEEFNRAFTVTCPDRKFASDILHPQMMELLLTHPDAAFRFDRRYVLTVGPGRSEIPEIDAGLALLDAVLDRVPDFVWRAAEGG